MPPTAPTTRRQIREAERQAPRLARSRATASVTTPAVGEERAQRSWAPRWLPRAAVLGALGAATIVAPLVGFTGGDDAAPAPAVVVDAVPEDDSALNYLDAAALRLRVSDEGDLAALRSDGDAAARALVHSSRGIDRDAAMCTYSGGPGANGARAAFVGESVVMPLAAGTYTQSSLYGNRVHPIAGTYSMHTGTDFAAPAGTPIHGIADGVVTHAGNGIDGRSSMLVIVRHEIEGVTFDSWYVHMYADGVYVEEGQEVRAGEVIGAVGSNGNSTGPHLHLEIHVDDEGTTTDPGAFLADHDARLLESGSAAC
ncbi:M23 family metallopeptidase [Georgenia sp. MJ170]